VSTYMYRNRLFVYPNPLPLPFGQGEEFGIGPRHQKAHLVLKYVRSTPLSQEKNSSRAFVALRALAIGLKMVLPWGANKATFQEALIFWVLIAIA